jgi:glycosyltransferase involved in cell wall biosynthesis
MKILIVSSYLPYPLHSGGHVRLYNLIRELSDRHEITLICEKRPHQTEKDIEEVEKICKKVVTVERRKQWSLKNIAKAAFSPHSFLVTGHTHPLMQERIQEELEHNSFDLIHVETFYVLQNVLESGIRNQESGIPPIVLVEHNIEYQVYGKFMDRVPAALRPLLALDIAKIRREEEAAWRSATALVAVSEEDKKVMKAAGFDAKIVANGVDIESFAFRSGIRNQESGIRKILFIGDFKWIQNQDSAKFIIQDIWPQIISNFKFQISNFQLKLWIVAREIPASVLGLTEDAEVIFDVESSGRATPEIFQEADVLLAPIRVGGGTSYKILESMACGTPVVTMQMSADAIHAKDGEHLMVGQTAEELAQKTLHVLQNEEVYEKIAQNGRELIEEHYSWKEIARKLEEVYQLLIYTD